MHPTPPTAASGFWVWSDTQDTRGADGSGRVEVRFVGRPATAPDPSDGPVSPPALGTLLDAVVPAGIERSWLRQIHSAEVVDAVACGAVGAEPPQADGLVSGRGSLALAVVTADCVPVLLAGGDRVAAVHAGWRGLAAGIVPRAVERLVDAVPADDLTAWIGPAIGPCCYEVGEDVATQVVASSDPSIATPGRRGRPHLDLRRAAALQLASRGVHDIRQLGPCTQCSVDQLWSYRRDGAGAGRNVALVWRT